MRQELKDRLKRTAPRPVLRSYLAAYRRIHRLRLDLPVLLRFFVRSSPAPGSPGKLRLLSCFRRIHREVECPHEPRELLALATDLLALDPAVPGVLVEAGCYRGGSTAKLSLVARRIGRPLYVFDSFDGLPGNDEAHDRDLFGQPLSFPGGAYAGSQEEVRANVARFGDAASCRLVKGWFEETMPAFRQPVAAAFLDVDLASSTRTCLKYLYPLLTPGGILYSHDGHIPLVVEVFSDRRFWREEVGCEPPPVEGLGTRKLLRIRKPGGRADARDGYAERVLSAKRETSRVSFSDSDPEDGAASAPTPDSWSPAGARSTPARQPRS